VSQDQNNNNSDKSDTQEDELWSEQDPDQPMFSTTLRRCVELMDDMSKSYLGESTAMILGALVFLAYDTFCGNFIRAYKVLCPEKELPTRDEMAVLLLNYALAYDLESFPLTEYRDVLAAQAMSIFQSEPDPIVLDEVKASEALSLMVAKHRGNPEMVSNMMKQLAGEGGDLSDSQRLSQVLKDIREAEARRKKEELN